MKESEEKPQESKLFQVHSSCHLILPPPAAPLGALILVVFSHLKLIIKRMRRVKLAINQSRCVSRRAPDHSLQSKAARQLEVHGLLSSRPSRRLSPELRHWHRTHRPALLQLISRCQNILTLQKQSSLAQPTVKLLVGCHRVYWADKSGTTSKTQWFFPQRRKPFILTNVMRGTGRWSSGWSYILRKVPGSKPAAALLSGVCMFFLCTLLQVLQFHPAKIPCCFTLTT